MNDSGESSDHHYVPQFYLRNFACDVSKKKINSVTKHGDRAIWKQKSIEYIGLEADLYTTTVDGIPISVESLINSGIETPISSSSTWKKIRSNQSDQLDISDKPVIYALMMHLVARTPHARSTGSELMRMANDGTGSIEFSQEELEMYRFMKDHPEEWALIENQMNATTIWAENNYRMACLSICRTTTPLYASTTPVMPMSTPPHPSLHLPLPNQVPYSLAITLNPHSFAILTLADFDNAFANEFVADEVAKGYNRLRVEQFANAPDVQHLIAGREGLEAELKWAEFELENESGNKMTFIRNAA